MSIRTAVCIICNIIVFVVGITLMTIGILKFTHAKDMYTGRVSRLSILTISQSNNYCVYKYTFTLNNSSIIYDGTYSNTCNSGDLLILTPYYNVIHYKEATPTSNYIGETPTHDISTTIAILILTFGVLFVTIGILFIIYLIMIRQKENQSRVMDKGNVDNVIFDISPV